MGSQGGALHKFFGRGPARNEDMDPTGSEVL